MNPALLPAGLALTTLLAAATSGQVQLFDSNGDAFDNWGGGTGQQFIADGSGVVFLPADRAEEIVAAAETFFAREQDMVRAIDAGTPVGAVMAGNYERMLENG